MSDIARQKELRTKQFSMRLPPSVVAHVRAAADARNISIGRMVEIILLEWIAANC